VRLGDRQHVRGLGWLRGHWELVGEAGILATGDLDPLDAVRGDAADVALRGWPTPLPAGAGWVTVRFTTARDEPWAEAGFEVCWDQLELPDMDAAALGGPLAVGSGTATGAAAPIEIGADGDLVHPLLSAPPRLALWRAPTDNDRFGGMAERWLAQGLADPVPGPATVERRDAGWQVEREVRVGSAVVLHRQTLTAAADGSVHVGEEAVIPPELVDLPRVGSILEIVPGLEHVEWFGRGPHESYPDRRRSAVVGRWRSSVDELFTPYVRPQEAGGRADVRWLELRDATGAGLRLSMDAPMQVSATHFRAADLDATTHADELRPRAETIVHIDAAHRGLGTASCGPDTTDEYIVGPGTYRWAWTLQTRAPGS
jgi:beta-galactosidase